MNTVSSASITGMVVSLILCVAAPVALCILLKRKTAAKLSDMFLGVVIFILFVWIFHGILENVKTSKLHQIFSRILLSLKFYVLNAAQTLNPGRYLIYFENCLDRCYIKA